MKTIDRCCAKVENDYLDTSFPQCSQLMDIVRGSVTCQTIEQLLTAYAKLTEMCTQQSSPFKMARVKNGFADTQNTAAYKDIKVNLLYTSKNDDKLRLICEMQFLLSDYLVLKKKSHKPYEVYIHTFFLRLSSYPMCVCVCVHR